jgi:hypothetical protein
MHVFLIFFHKKKYLKKASKWCTLVFPQEFLEKCLALSNHSERRDYHRRDGEHYSRRSALNGGSSTPRTKTGTSETGLKKEAILSGGEPLPPADFISRNKSVTLKNFSIRNIFNEKEVKKGLNDEPLPTSSTSEVSGEAAGTSDESISSKQRIRDSSVDRLDLE